MGGSLDREIRERCRALHLEMFCPALASCRARNNSLFTDQGQRKEKQSGGQQSEFVSVTANDGKRKFDVDTMMGRAGNGHTLCKAWKKPTQTTIIPARLVIF